MVSALGTIFLDELVSMLMSEGRPRSAWVYVRNTEFDTKVLDNDWRSFQGKREAFTEALLAAHEVDVVNFYEELTGIILAILRLRHCVVKK